MSLGRGVCKLTKPSIFRNSGEEGEVEQDTSPNHHHHHSRRGITVPELEIEAAKQSRRILNERVLVSTAFQVETDPRRARNLKP